MTTGTILVVDDDPDLLATVQAALEEDGYHVLTATGETVVGTARQVQPDVILLDVRMPHPDGGELSLALHALPETAAIPLVLMSATPGLPTISTMLPVVGHLRKPFSLEDLGATIARWVAVRQEQPAAAAQPLPPATDPPRHPLRIRPSMPQELPDGASVTATGWRVLAPTDPQYETVYQEAARGYRLYGWPMPYAEPEFPAAQ